MRSLDPTPGCKAHNGDGGAAHMMQDTVSIMEGADGRRTGMSKHFVARAETLATL